MALLAHPSFPDLLSILRCIECRSAMELLEQRYRCTSCGKELPIVRGVGRFVGGDNYADTFGYQWQEFARTQLKPQASEMNFLKKTALTKQDLEGKLVLDVGCGMGRFADVATRWGARVIGVDLSAAAEVAAHNLADRDFIAFQADVFNLPFAPGSFDCIYSIGVLHHTPDCEKAFKKLPQYLRPGGTIGVWLYSGYNKWYRFSDYYRKLTHRIPTKRMHAILRVAVPVAYWFDRGVRRIPLAGAPLSGLVRYTFPISRNPNPEIRLLDTLDWYTPTYQSKHTYEQVFRWFESCGLKNLTVADISIGVRGQKCDDSNSARSEIQQDLQNSPDTQARSLGNEPKQSARAGLFSVPARKVSRTLHWLPSYAWQRATRRASTGPVHLIIALADHFEPAITPNHGSLRAPKAIQVKRLQEWCREYPRGLNELRDHDGRPFVHSYFYPAEQYDRDIVGCLADFCHTGWGEVEVHLHHGAHAPDTAENTRRTLLEFRDTLAFEHGCLSHREASELPVYAFVHGNFALANSAGGQHCGVDSEIQILAQTGCYADLTLPPGPYYRSHITKINSLYECSLPLDRRAAHREGRSLSVGRSPAIFPLIIQGPLMLSFSRPDGKRGVRVESGVIASNNPPSLNRLQLWKQAAVTVNGRPDWLFIKLHCHGMDPRDRDVMLGRSICEFLSDLIEGAQSRAETLHFVTAREMVNIILAACDGREGNPGEFRDYRLKKFRDRTLQGTERVDAVLMGR
jgi:SAM-dependent methyltransferase